jgi:cyanophycin synthetase
LRQGVQEINPNIPCITILDEAEAISAALDSAPQSSLVVVFPDKVDAAIAIIEARKSKLS